MCISTSGRSYRAAEAAEEDEAALATPQPERPERAQVENSVHLRTLVSGPDGRVYLGFASGYLKCFSALGRLIFKKAGSIAAQVAGTPWGRTFSSGPCRQASLPDLSFAPPSCFRRDVTCLVKWFVQFEVGNMLWHAGHGYLCELPGGGGTEAVGGLGRWADPGAGGAGGGTGGHGGGGGVAGA